MTTKQHRNALADVLVAPRPAAWFHASPAGDPSMPGEDIVALGLLGGAMPELRCTPGFGVEIAFPFARPEAAKGRAAGDEDEDEEEVVDDDEDDEEDDEEDEDDEDEDEDEDEDDDFLDDDEEDDDEFEDDDDKDEEDGFSEEE